MPRDFGKFKCVRVSHGLRSFDVHVFVLITVEALHIMRGEATLGAAHARHTLHEADHGLLAV